MPALRGLSFEVGWGERLAIFGPNGAGKTTLLRVLAGLLRPTRGEVRVAGLDPTRQGAATRALTGVLSHQTYLFGELTVAENLRLYGRLFDVEAREERIGGLLEQVGLYGRRFDRVDSLSRGLQQRLAIARALLHDPRVLLLDEPDTGLDLAATQVLESTLLAADPRRALLMATHNLDLARRLCDRAVVLVAGRLVSHCRMAALDAERLSRLYRAPALPAR